MSGMPAIGSALALDRPERLLGLVIAAQVVFWTLAPTLGNASPPLDVVEMYVWGREGVVATAKHPNLPGLVLELTRRVTGQVGWPAYLMSQLFVVATIWIAYVLGRELTDAPRALAGALLLTGVYFFSWPTPEFNHNVAQMPLWAAVMLFTWRATTRSGVTSWILLGLCAGLSIWAKYSSVLLLAVAAAWLIWDRDARGRLLTPGPWIALAVFLAVVAPQALWLVEHDFSPLAYAARRASGDWFSPFEFVLEVALDHLPMLLLVLAAGLFVRPKDQEQSRVEARALRFLLLFGLGPAALAVTGAIATGAGLRTSWAAPMVVLSGLLALTALRAAPTERQLRRLAVGAVALIVVVSSLYAGSLMIGPRLTGKPLRGNWPQAQIARALEDAWVRETNAPLRIVSGDVWMAGLVALDRRNPPSVLINGDFEFAPWVTRDEARRDGVLLVWSERYGAPPPVLELSGGLDVRSVEVAFQRHQDIEPLTIFYAIAPPDSPAP
jgi:4-amino-4-deoxy-L-arabinose transferase-like glycosyltransferase